MNGLRPLFRYDMVSLVCSRQRQKRQGYERFFFFFFPRDSEVPTYGYKYVYTGKQIRIVNVENKACFERTANKYTFILIPKPTRRAPAPDPPPPADYGGTICLCYGLYRKPRVTNKSLLTSRALPSTV